MGVGELIEEIRALYVTRLRQALAAHGDVRAEPVVAGESGEALRTGALKLPSRCDGITTEEGAEKPVSVDSEGVLGFEAISFDWGEDLKVCLTPFCWDFAEFEVPSAGLKDLSENLVDWFERWFSVKTAQSSSEQGLAGVLHALSDVHNSGEHSSFQVDFGSAPLACFEDLLDVLGASRAVSVVVREAA